MEQKAAALIAANFDLAAGDEFIAAGANAPFIERRPFPPRIGRAQNIEAVFRGEMLLHRSANARAVRVAIGLADEPRILQILTIR